MIYAIFLHNTHDRWVGWGVGEGGLCLFDAEELNGRISRSETSFTLFSLIFREIVVASRNISARAPPCFQTFAF